MDPVFDTTELRRSSLHTNSSDGGTNQEEQIYENIRLHKEVIQSIKLQPWPIRKKLKLVRQAKNYVSRHEGALQERFAMSRSTRDLWARFKILLAARWHHWKRETASFLTVLIPWELRIKEIESHFGSGVASYFTFLRWLIWVNVLIALPLVVFVIGPEYITTKINEMDPRKRMTEDEYRVAGNLFTIWEFEGYLKYSPMFYGYYSNYSGASSMGYMLPLAYFLTAVAVYIYSFVATLRKMAENSRNSKLSSKHDECTFSWKLFTGWDFMIGHAETAHNRIASVVVGFKEALLEEAEKQKDKRNWRIILQRILVNLLVMILLAASGYTVVVLVNKSEEWARHDNWLSRNAVNVTMTLLSFFLPMIFEALGLFENLHPRQQLRLQLGRIMVLNLLNLYSLMFSFIYKINSKEKPLRNLKLRNETAAAELAALQVFWKSYQTLNTTSDVGAKAKPQTTPSSLTSEILTQLFNSSAKVMRCYNVTVNCSKLWPSSPANATLAGAFLLMNFTSPTVMPTAIVASAQPSEIHATISTFANFSIIDSYPQPPSRETVGFADFSLDNEQQTTASVFPTPSGSNDSDLAEYYDYLDEMPARKQRNAEQGTFSLQNGTDEDRTSQVHEVIPSANHNDTADTPETKQSYAPLESLWELNKRLQDVARYFTTSTSPASPTLPTATTSDSELTDEQLTDNRTESVAWTTETAHVHQGQAETSTDVSSTSISPDLTHCLRTVCEDLPSDFYSSLSTYMQTANVNRPEIEETTLSPLQVELHYHGSMSRLKRIFKEIERNLTSMCWETSLGQELSKVIVFDGLMSIVAPLCIDFLRALFVRYMNRNWCWDMEKTFPQYGDFKIAENILTLIYNQGQVWMGIFFSPGLVLINLLKLVIMMYFRSWIVLTCNVPHEVVFKASKSNNFYLSLLLAMLFLCVLPVGYAIVWLRPSWHCGPFSDYNRISEFITNTTRNALPKQLHGPLNYFTSSSTVIPLLLLLTLIIYYLVSLTGALREANQDLRTQLQKEREEERKKLFKLSEMKPAETSLATNRWRKILEASSLPKTAVTSVDYDTEEYKNQARKELITRIMRKALRKSSATSEEDSIVQLNEDDGGDCNPNEIDDNVVQRNVVSKSFQTVRKARKHSLIDIVQIARSEMERDRDRNNCEREQKALKNRKPCLMHDVSCTSENLLEKSPFSINFTPEQGNQKSVNDLQGLKACNYILTDACDSELDVSGGAIRKLRKSSTDTQLSDEEVLPQTVPRSNSYRIVNEKSKENSSSEQANVDTVQDLSNSNEGNCTRTNAFMTFLRGSISSEKPQVEDPQLSKQHSDNSLKDHVKQP